MSPAVMWFRRDLRLSDNPALEAAIRHAGPDGEVVAVFCLDPRLLGPSGRARRAFLSGCLEALDADLGGRLVVRSGRPEAVVPARGGRDRRRRRVRRRGLRALRPPSATSASTGRSPSAMPSWSPSGSPYAVPPGEVAKAGGDPYKVFTPYARAWRAHGWPEPAPAPGDVALVDRRSRPTASPPPPAVAARAARGGRGRGAAGGARGSSTAASTTTTEARDRPDLDASSRLSPYLKWGCIHPRQLLAELGGGEAHSRFRDELCWREFYADVLWHRPDTVHQAFRPEMRQMEVDTGPADALGVPGLGRGSHGLPDRRRRACGSWPPRGGCTTGCA